MATAPKAPPGLELALLGFLRREPMHAYEIHARLAQAEALGLVWRIKQSHLYALLARLEEAGYLVGSVQPQSTRPPRRMLALTAEGRDAFERWLTAPVAHGRDFRLEFLAKLFFATQEDAGSVATLIAAQRTACDRWLADLHEHVASLEADRVYERLVLGFRASQIEALMRWLDECETTLGSPGASEQ
jgi:PadR family transcriptional regulator AphA